MRGVLLEWSERWNGTMRDADSKGKRAVLPERKYSTEWSEKQEGGDVVVSLCRDN
jgi:hypothetical protein